MISEKIIIYPDISYNDTEHKTQIKERIEFDQYIYLDQLFYM